MKLKITISFNNTSFYVKDGICIIDTIPLPNDETGMKVLNQQLDAFITSREVGTFLTPDLNQHFEEQKKEAIDTVRAIGTSLKEEVVKVINRMDLNKSDKETGFVIIAPVSATVKLVSEKTPFDTLPVHSF